jgi:hypothetical protein
MAVSVANGVGPEILLLNIGPHQVAEFGGLEVKDDRTLSTPENVRSTPFRAKRADVLFSRWRVQPQDAVLFLRSR